MSSFIKGDRFGLPFFTARAKGGNGEKISAHCRPAHRRDDPFVLDWVSDSNWTTYLFEYFDRADANLSGIGPEGDEPPKPGVLKRIDQIDEY